MAWPEFSQACPRGRKWWWKGTCCCTVCTAISRRRKASAASRSDSPMINQIVSFALEKPLFIVIGLVMFVTGGLAAFHSLPIEAFPDVTDTQVNVITLYPGRAAEEVEKQVTVPLEVALSGLPNAVRMFSHTQFGLSFIIITFDDRANAYFARQQVVERLNGVDLPPGVQPQLAPLSSPIGEIYRYLLKGDGVSPTELRSIEDWVVERQLKTVPGVADVVS